MQSPLDFYSIAISDSSPKIISEIKKASPSKGIICENFDPIKIAKSYEVNGASAISILTDEKFFQGSLDYLSQIRTVVNIPLLRKDFTIDPYQIHEARAHGADIVLLIAAILDKDQIKEYLEIVDSLNMNAIVEIHNHEELDKVIDTGCKIIGINNRNLMTFEVDLSTTVELIKFVPEDILVISESGISDLDDIRMLRKLGVNTFLIGESFMKSDDPGGTLQKYISQIEPNPEF
jgi:indole-3-glycerol phosphate synthase